VPGAPDFAAEILSPSNTAGEMRRKFELYRKSGVREYWELDPESKTLFTYCFKDGSVTTRYYHSGETIGRSVCANWRGESMAAFLPPYSSDYNPTVNSAVNYYFGVP
jgi:Uma2 family endonuclease